MRSKKPDPWVYGMPLDSNWRNWSSVLNAKEPKYRFIRGRLYACDIYNQSLCRHHHVRRRRACPAEKDGAQRDRARRDPGGRHSCGAEQADRRYRCGEISATRCGQRCGCTGGEHGSSGAAFDKFTCCLSKGRKRRNVEMNCCPNKELPWEKWNNWNWMRTAMKSMRICAAWLKNTAESSVGIFL